MGTVLRIPTYTYYDNNTAVFVRNFTYDTYGNCIETECVNP